MKGNFIDNLPKIYGLYTGGFIVFILLMAILEQLGVSADTIGESIPSPVTVTTTPTTSSTESAWRLTPIRAAPRPSDVSPSQPTKTRLVMNQTIIDR